MELGAAASVPGLQNFAGVSEVSGAKIDQYLKQDPEWKGCKPDHELQKLSEVCVKHATHIYYALVCRTALGAAASTKAQEPRSINT